MIKYRVHLYPVVRIGIDVEAKTSEEAEFLAMNNLKLNKFLENLHKEYPDNKIIEFTGDYHDDAIVDIKEG